jgi:hypothetical protein
MNDLAVQQNTELAQAQAKSLEQMNQAAEVVVTQIQQDRDKADETIEFMKELIEIDNDKNSSTRDAIASLVNSKMTATSNLIRLLELKGKMLNPNKGLSVNINVGGKYDADKGGDTNSMIDAVESMTLDINDDN